MGYQPARSIDALTVHYVMKALDERGVSKIPMVDSEEMKKLFGSLRGLDFASEKSPANLLLRDM